MTAITPHKDWVLQLVHHRMEPDWLRDLRLRALAAFAEAPDVARGQEEIGKRASGLFAPSHLPGSDVCTFPLETFFQGEKDNRVVYHNRKTVTHHMATHWTEQGVLFLDLSLAVRMFPRLVRPHLGQVLAERHNKWAALQTALWNAGLFLYVPKGVRVDVPLQAWWERTQSGGQLHPRLLVVAEEDSSVTLLAGEVSQLEEPAFSLQVTEVVAKARAHVRLLTLQEQDAKMTRLTFQKARAEQEATVEWLLADVGTGYSVVETQAVLAGNEARLNGQALFLGAEQQHLDLTLTAEHVGRNTSSRLHSRGIVTDQARSLTRAVSRIAKGAVGTNSRQEERMIVLSKQAQAQAVPMLLIADEDVRCDHALSVGPIRQDHLFYLMSRGLPEAEAKRLLLMSFLAPLGDSWRLEGLTRMLEDWVERKVAP